MKEVISVNHQTFSRALALAGAAVLALSLSLPASALLLTQAEAAPAVAAVSKNGPAAEPITFSSADFRVEEGDAALDAIVISQLPDASAGSLSLGGQAVSVGDQVAMQAVEGLCFTPAAGTREAVFTVTPVFAGGLQGAQVTVGLHLLAQENAAPVAENLELNTYKNVAVTGQLTAVDPEGDLLTFHLLDKPGRGSVTLSEDGSGGFVYTPYENKTGKDSFTYVAVDAVGNTSDPAKVKVRIEKADTKVTYSDMSGHPAHKAAIRLAEENIFVGERLGGAYCFSPDAPITRGEFVAMAMAAAGLETLEGVARTGFADDADIPTWAKPYASAALKCGLVLGSQDGAGRTVFNADAPITRAEAAVLLDRALQVTDVSGTLYVETTPVWASQSVANLSACGMLPSNGSLLLEDTLNRGEAAQLLCSALELQDSRHTSWLPWK